MVSLQQVKDIPNALCQSGIKEGTAEAVAELTTAVTVRESNEELEPVQVFSKFSGCFWTAPPRTYEEKTLKRLYSVSEDLILSSLNTSMMNENWNVDKHGCVLEKNGKNICSTCTLEFPYLFLRKLKIQ